jgi:deoxyribonuclease IV
MPVTCRGPGATGGHFSMLRLGAHESVAGGLHRAIERAESAGCESLQLWTRNARRWYSPPLEAYEICQFRTALAKSSIQPVVAHAAYLINIASPDPDLFRRSVRCLIEETQRCESLGIPYIILHPGAHTGSGMEAGLVQAAAGLSETIAALPGGKTRILLETTAGQGTALGGTFENLARIIEQVSGGPRPGICLDTCHAFSAGYELRTAEGYAETMAQLDRYLGLEALRVVHLNDSRFPLGSHRDRHEHIGEGHLGLDGFVHLLTDPRLDGLPGILETPKSDDLHEDQENLARLRALSAGLPVEIVPLAAKIQDNE